MGGGIRLSATNYFSTSNYLPIWAGFPYTISFWVYLTGLSYGAYGIFGGGNFELNQKDGSGPQICPVYNTEDFRPFWVDCSVSNSTDYNRTNAQYSKSNSWRHIACTRDENGIIRFFLDGKIQVQLNRAGQTYRSCRVFINNAYHFENYNDNRHGIGYMDDLVLISGKALWTANFTPPITYLENYYLKLLFENSNNMYGILKKS